MFCGNCGNSISASDRFCGRCGTPQNPPAEADERTRVLQAIGGILGQYPQLTLTWGQKADLEISNELANANWGVGKKKIEYKASLVADPALRTVHFWEMIKESGSGMMALFSFKKETYRTDGTTRSGTVNETAYGAQGKVIDYNWDYAQTRQLVEQAVRSQGWQFKTVLLKGKATY